MTKRQDKSPSREPWVLTCLTGYKKRPQRGVLVYPLGDCRFRMRSLGKASGYPPPRANRGFSPVQRDTKNARKGAFWCTRWEIAASACGASAKRRGIPPSREPWVLTCLTGYKKRPQRGVLVYPLGDCRFRMRSLGKASGYPPLARTVGSHLYNGIQKTPAKGRFGVPVGKLPLPHTEPRQSVGG